MNRNSSLWVMLAMMATCGAFAQVYKSIGPDGKTIYSDSPPPADSKSSTVISKPAQPPPASPASPSTDAPATLPPKSMAEKKAAAVKGTRVGPTPAEVLAPAARDPKLEKAVVGILGLEDLVAQTEEICQRTLPTSFKRYSTAEPWKQRNAALLAQARRALSEAFNDSERQIVQSGVKARNAEILSPVTKAPTASKIKWCDQSADEINSGRMDLSNKPDLSTPLMNYRSKAG